MRRIGIEELLASSLEVDELRRVLSQGAVAAVPTETFYGLAADPLDAAGVQRIRELKRRGAASPFLVLVAERRQLEALGVAAPATLLDRYFALWPAPLTVIVPLRAPIPASLGESTLAIRVPAHEALRRLLTRVGPLTGTSANRTGEDPCADPGEVARLFDGELDVLVDGGPTAGGLASTLLDATVDPPQVRRAGAFRWPPANR